METKPAIVQPQLKDIVSKMQPQLELAIPKHLSADRMMRIALTAISSNPKLAESTPASFLGSLMSAAQLGLEPNTPMGQAYLIPYKNNKLRAMECQFQIGYKGMLDLCYRSNEFKTIYAKTVHENDEFEYKFGLDPDLIHVPAHIDRGNVVAYYAVYKTTSGGVNFEVMSRQEVEEHGKKFSKSYAFGPWKNHFDEMGKKTVLKRLLKTAPQSADLRNANSIDQAVIKIDPAELAGSIEALPVGDVSYNDEGTVDSEEKAESLKKVNDLLGK